MMCAFSPANLPFVSCKNARKDTSIYYCLNNSFNTVERVQKGRPSIRATIIIITYKLQILIIILLVKQ